MTVALLMAIAVYLVFFQQHTVRATVSGFRWERSVEVERFGAVRESDWSVPPGGRLVTSYPAVHHTIQVLDHYETRTRQVPHVNQRQESYPCSRNLGNGRFEADTCSRTVSETTYTQESYQEAMYRTDPVYWTRYDYDIDRWHVVDTVRLGESDQVPVWPAVPTTETQRPGMTAERYVVVFSDGETTYELAVPLVAWTALQVNQAVELSVNRQDQVKEYELI